VKKLLVVKKQSPDDPHARTADNVELIQIKNTPANVPTVLPVCDAKNEITVRVTNVKMVLTV